MKKIQVNARLSISDQITLEDVSLLAACGTSVIICNRPDGEEVDQITCAQIEAEAILQGLEFVHIPVPGRDVPESASKSFNQWLDNEDATIHAYCRTGMRSSIFWALSLARKHTASDIFTKANKLGINLTPATEQINRASVKN
ncbi:MAG: TIGR01244 family phosphatase [Kangiellaceae bacterium]|nr:TIGR01244 family phosphatase [Kangiellaceae bacterium]